MGNKINWVGIIISIAFLALSFDMAKNDLENSRRALNQGNLVIAAIGIFFLVMSLKGKSTREILNTNVSGDGLYSKLFWPVSIFFIILFILTIIGLLLFTTGRLRF